MRPLQAAAAILVLAAVLVLPRAASANCGCGPTCGCGPGCRCAPTPPPTPPPNANQIRKDQATLTNQEKQAFVDAVKQLKQNYRPGSSISVYDEYVHMHMMGMMQSQIHDGPAFFPWHRQFLRNFELELQAINPTVTLPYWNFTIDNSPKSSIWAPNFMGGNGDPKNGFAVQTGPFRQGEWMLAFEGTDLRRQFGGWTGIGLPTPNDVARGMLINKYDSVPFNSGSDITRSFRNYMTGWNHPSGEAEMHNRVHEWVGGSMMGMGSPNDPVFFLMHAYLDRLWGEWMDIWGPDYPASGAAFGHNLNDPLFLFGNTPASVLNHHALGYWYDSEPLSAVPEPATVVLWGLGAAGLLGFGWWKRRHPAATDDCP